MAARIKGVAAMVGLTACTAALGANIAQAGTYPEDSTYEIGGAGETTKAGPGAELSLAESSFSPEVIAVPACGAIPWGGGCG